MGQTGQQEPSCHLGHCPPGLPGPRLPWATSFPIQLQIRAVLMCKRSQSSAVCSASCLESGLAETTAGLSSVSHAGLWQLSTSTLAQAELGTHTEQQALAAMASSSTPGLHCPSPSVWPSLVWTEGATDTIYQTTQTVTSPPCS